MGDNVTAVLAGDRRAVAKAITRVENGGEPARELLSQLHDHVGEAHRVGITGPPGAGKSTLVAALVTAYRSDSDRVGVVAVDPTSPFSGGALLGDRVRMSALTTDPGVFIRSMASRGAFGGLARAAWDAVDVLDASGCRPVFVETVGVGQTEVEIAGLADTTVVVLSPEAGDNVQAMKAGLMEVADVFVINKCDREGAETLARNIRGMLELRQGPWDPPIVRSSALRNEGIENVRTAIDAHRNHLVSTGALETKRREAIRRRVLDILDDGVRERFWTDERRRALEREVDAIAKKEGNPVESAMRILGNWRNVS